MNQLDLCGTSGLAVFYLAMERALDVLVDLPHADVDRVAMAGLSGGGWQTILLSSLDRRVTLANPVAGYSSFKTRVEFFADIGDSEQAPTDLANARRLPAPHRLTGAVPDAVDLQLEGRIVALSRTMRCSHCWMRRCRSISWRVRRGDCGRT